MLRPVFYPKIILPDVSRMCFDIHLEKYMADGVLNLCILWCRLIVEIYDFLSEKHVFH